MIHQPLAIAAILLAIECGILFLSDHPRTKHLFKFLPAVFWIYFLPMVVSSFGLIDSQSDLYRIISKYFLPASLFLLLLAVDVKAILKLGPKALLMMAVGSLGIMAGTVIVFVLFKGVVGEKMWSGFGALSASWTGGSANMIAVREALSVPDSVYLPMVVVDTIVPYFWMGILMSVVALQPAFDRWNNADRRILEELNEQIKRLNIEKKDKSHLLMTVVIVVFALCGGKIALFIGYYLPPIKEVISMGAWTIIAASTLGLVLSFTQAREIEHYGSNRVGYFLLYFVLTSIGAKASISDINASLILIAAGFLIVLIHAVFLIVTARLIRAPFFLVAVASQANVGGVASTPIVAEVYQPGLASVGLLLAVLGGIVGTYLGIMTGHLCHLM